MAVERRAITVTGLVQGVGFRPFVHGVATRLGLAGFVRNEGGSVRVEAEGEPLALDSLIAAVQTNPPPLARVEGVSWERVEPLGASTFRIEASENAVSENILISADIAVCPECLAELFDPADRRFGYPFLNCTRCGPRLTVVTGAPYDRARTTLAGFPMCPACRAEYDDPSDRRFHAQPTACPACGPRLSLRDGRGVPIETDAPLEWFAAAILDGRIGALKGLGGYHLVCDARDDAAVVDLRRRKSREEKPFAVMVADLAGAEALCKVSTEERRLLESPAAPIVLLIRRPEASLAGAVAPENPRLGVMLPYTPLHHLLLRAVGGAPLVMTSGNRSDEPIAHEDADALERLADIADLFLVHDRPIHVRCDDSVTRVTDGRESPLRRSRGYAPQPLSLPRGCDRPTLAVGGQLKGAFALGRGRRAILSHHLGDLDHYEAFRAFVRDVALYEELFEMRPARVVHDLHPEYASTHHAVERARAEGLDRLAVQHHHAHMASCMAENGLEGPVIGVTFDGAGFGADGTVWGGEFLVGGYEGFRRAAHLRTVALPGGDAAAREPWRMALAHLVDAGVENARLVQRVDPKAFRLVRAVLDRPGLSPRTSSAGRLFDAVSCLAGLRDRVSYEGQAAVELEWRSAAAPGRDEGVYPFELADAPGAPLVIDTRALVRAVSEEADRGLDARAVGRRFHSTLVEMIARVCLRLRAAEGLDTVVLSGGVFFNGLLAAEVPARLRREGFCVGVHRLVPPNDGGICLGQLAVAAATAP
ncbi:MAG: carbamoyltransferase HypF [Isosphaeraceae bacterium]